MGVTTDFAEVLTTVQRPGDFVTSGTIELLPPSISVDCVGRIALPLLPAQAAALIAVAEQAPYGRGPATLFDTSVRRTWQIGREHVHIGGRHWPRTLETIVTRVAENLGVADPVEAEFYKLLVYDEGSFFVGHRDTEKSPGMFATLVIVLPSESSGGELLVRHKDREVRLPLLVDDPSEAAYAAFYADCVHEVLPVTSGCRLTLVYNLLRHGPGRVPEVPDYASQRDRLVEVLQAWRADHATIAARPPQTTAPPASDDAAEPDFSDAVPEKLVYLLEHAYTQAELGFAALKGADGAAAAVLVPAAREAGCTLNLSLLTIEESGSAEYVGRYDRHRRGHDDHDDADDYEIGEDVERWITLTNWRTVDGSASPLGALPVELEEVSPPKALEELDPDEEHFEEATGNAGASFARTYRRAALVLWPADRIFAVLSQAGLSVTLPYLADLADRWEEAGADRASPLRRDAHDLAGHMIAQWPKSGWHGHYDGSESEAARMVRVLCRLDDAARIEAMLERVVAAGAYGKGDNAAVVEALALLPPRQALQAVQRIVAAMGATVFGACANLLSHLAPTHGAALRDAALLLLAGIPGDPAQRSRDLAWRRDSGVDASLVADLLSALSAIDPELAGRAVAHVLARPKPYDADGILVPAALSLAAAGTGGLAAERLRAACLAHLRVRIGEPLAAPPDWQRQSTLKCPCPRCRELAVFLADPEARTWVLRAAQDHRGHIEATIASDRCDVDTKTETRGRPYSLVCTKNQASYQRRVVQRTKDLADLAALGG
ncbi:MAG TPA: 2OG-Fe(II) oxygenase [Acetobacteraceae bacterium]|jgi:predicted 2-oxoglutarate/Fe(II)-dependent dioxygenase YbiX